MHPWQQIPYSDYEEHMMNKSVYQLQTLNHIFATHLKSLCPKSVLVLGCGAGNGFENIDDHITDKVIGIDINESYLEICKDLYSSKNYSLELLSCDFEKEKLENIKVDFISCALFFEYVNIEKALSKIHMMLKDHASLNIVIQRSNKINFVSNTQIESLNVLDGIASEIDEKQFEDTLIEKGFVIGTKEIRKLPNGKEFVDYICKVI